MVTQLNGVYFIFVSADHESAAREWLYRFRPVFTRRNPNDSHTCSTDFTDFWPNSTLFSRGIWTHCTHLFDKIKKNVLLYPSFAFTTSIEIYSSPSVTLPRPPIKYDEAQWRKTHRHYTTYTCFFMENNRRAWGKSSDKMLADLFQCTYSPAFKMLTIFL